MTKWETHTLLEQRTKFIKYNTTDCVCGERERVTQYDFMAHHNPELTKTPKTRSYRCSRQRLRKGEPFSYPLSWDFWTKDSNSPSRKATNKEKPNRNKAIKVSFIPYAPPAIHTAGFNQWFECTPSHTYACTDTGITSMYSSHITAACFKGSAI